MICMYLPAIKHDSPMGTADFPADAREEILATLEAAPLLGLVPRGQLHAWLASLQETGMTEEMVHLLEEGLSVAWVRCSAEFVPMSVKKSRICDGEY